MITQFEQYDTLYTDLVKSGGNWWQKHPKAVVEYATDNTCWWPNAQMKSYISEVKSAAVCTKRKVDANG